MKYALSVFALLLSLSTYGQFDDKGYDFKRNSIRVGVGSLSANTFQVQYRKQGSSISKGSRDVEVEYERHLNRYFSANVLYRFIDYNLVRYIYKEHQRQVNFFYAPFNNSWRVQFKIGAGLVNTSIHETNFLVDTPGLPFTRSTQMDWGITGITELDFTLAKNISMGIKGFRQFTINDESTYGGILRIGYSF